MERLKIYSQSGDLLLERDLSDAAATLLVIAGEKPELAESAPAGAKVAGAIVRDEDGWSLASADPGIQVVSGPRKAADLHLTAGIACSLGDWIFRIEREGAEAGLVLLWRVGSGSVVADPILVGRNVVATRPSDGAYEVNPAIAGTEVCELFPTADGNVEVVTPGNETQRLSAAAGALFAVGPFQAMVLDAASASAAVKSGNPFSWPSRGTRSALMLAAIAVGVICLGGAYLSRERSRLESELAAPRGAERIDFATTEPTATDEDSLVYFISFYRSLPLILKAERSQITQDLISRGKQLSGMEGIDDAVTFLQNIDAIQLAVSRGDWDGLKDTLERTDDDMFVKCDGDKFHEDAHEIVDFVTVALPKFLVSAMSFGEKEFAEAGNRVHELFNGMKDNVFMSGEIVSREKKMLETRWNALVAYVPARNRYFRGEGGVGKELLDAWAQFVDAFDPEDPTFAPIVKKERDDIAKAILKSAESAKDAELVRLCDIGEAVGIDDEVLKDWKHRAVVARKRLAAQYRSLYGDYRARAAVAPGAPETLAVLDRMLEIGLEDNAFHQWAERERVRVTAPPQEGAAKDASAKKSNEKEGSK